MRAILLLLFASTGCLSAAAHTYWRVIGTGTYVGTRAGLSSVVFYDAGASVIPFSGGTGTVDATDVGSPANVFDNNTATDWVSGAGSSHWIKYQFASPVEVESFDLVEAGASWSTYGFVDFTLDYSDDDSTWTTKYTYKGHGANSLVSHHFDSSNVYVDSPAVFYRLTVNSNQGSGTGSDFLEIGDLKFYDGASAQIATSTYSASATSQLDFSTVQVSQMFDSDSTSFYLSVSAGWPKRITYRFGSTITPVTFAIVSGAEIGGLCTARAPATFDLDYSPDGSSWTSAGSYTSAAWTTCGQTQTFTISPAVSGSSVKSRRTLSPTGNRTGTRQPQEEEE